MKIKPMALIQLDKNIVSTATEYIEKITGESSDTIVDWDDTGDKSLISLDEFDMLQDIISLQVSFWSLRRLGNCCQSNSDSIYKLINLKIDAYNNTFKREFNNFNQDNIW